MNPFFPPIQSFARQSLVIREAKPVRAGVSRQAYSPWELDDVPHIFDSVAEFATCYAGTQAVIAYTDGIIFEVVGEIIVTLCHRADEDANALFPTQIRNIIFDPNNFGIITESHLTAVWWEVIGNWIFYHFE
jgi:hypothetical protein